MIHSFTLIHIYIILVLYHQVLIIQQHTIFYWLLGIKIWFPGFFILIKKDDISNSNILKTSLIFIIFCI